MKKTLLVLVAAFVALIGFVGCKNETTEVELVRTSATPVSNLKAVAIEGAIVVYWDYNGDPNSGYVVTRKSDTEFEKEVKNGSLSAGRTEIVDYYGKDNQLENGKKYTYTVYTKVSYAGDLYNKAASKSVSATAQVSGNYGDKAKKFTESDFTTKVVSMNGSRYLVLTCPAGYTYEAYVNEFAIRYTKKYESGPDYNYTEYLYTDYIDSSYGSRYGVINYCNRILKEGVDGTEEYWFDLEDYDEEIEDLKEDVDKTIKDYDCTATISVYRNDFFYDTTDLTAFKIDVTNVISK